MTNREAVIAEIEPFTIHPRSIDKSIIDASKKIGEKIDPSAEYDGSTGIAVASILVLGKLKVLASESEAGISKGYSVENIAKRIKELAKINGLCAEYFLEEDSAIENLTNRW